jgi:RHS repeat-associated protein
MKWYLISIFLLNTAIHLNAQFVGGSGNGESPTKAIKSASIDAGAFNGEVSLFTGTYNSSYPLGTVSTPSGLSYTAVMSYSSTFSAGDNMPHSTGIPYGEGWNLDLPMITVSTEDYNKYSIDEVQHILEGVAGMPPTLIFFENNNCVDGEEEGKLYYYAPRLNIPGYTSGRLVYKEKKGNDFVFVLHTFEKYVEAFLREDASWLIVLDDGTQYELKEMVFSHRNASNQRVHPQQTSCLQTNVLGNVLLPKTELLSWYCSKILHPNLVGEIRFNYERHGCFDFFSTYNSLANNINDYFFNGSLGSDLLPLPCKEIFLNEIISGYDDGTGTFLTINQLDLQYEADYSEMENIESAYKLPLESDPLYTYTPPYGQPTEDPLYSATSVYEESTCSFSQNDWKRFLHIRTEEVQVSCPDNVLTGYTNPYLGKFLTFLNPWASNFYYLWEDADCEPPTTGVPFKYGYLESPPLDMMDLPPGDVYEVKTILKNNAGADFLFDLNLAIGDERVGISSNSSFGDLNSELSSCNRKRTGESLFSTFNKGIKWFVPDYTSTFNSSNLFIMPSVPQDKFYFQIGAANADQLVNTEPTDVTTGNNPPDCGKMYPFYPSDPMNEEFDDPITSAAPIPYNFGNGYPWLMLKDMYLNMLGFNPCNYNNSTWWNKTFFGDDPCDYCQTSPTWPNEPTRLRDVDDSPSGNCSKEDVYLQEVKIIRYAKRPYMLKAATLQTRNESGSLVDVNSIQFEYRLEKVQKYVNTIVDDVSLPQTEEDASFTGPDIVSGELRKRNIFTLTKIEQLPANPGGGGQSTNYSTHFKYTATDDMTFEAVCNAYIIGENYMLTEMTDAIGKKTTIDYLPVSQVVDDPWWSNYVPPGQASYTLKSFDYKSRPYSSPNLYPSGEIPCSLTTPYNACLFPGSGPWDYILKRGRPYAYQTYMVVDKKIVEDREGSKKVWEYDFNQFKLFPEQTRFEDNFQYDKSFNPRGGFGQAIVKGPIYGADEPYTTYTHSTDPLLWGKLLAVSSRDADAVLINSASYQYEAMIAFESPVYRLNNQGPGYYSEYAVSGRPVIPGNEVDQTYISAIKSWLGGNQTLDHPDFSQNDGDIPGTQYDVPYFYETRYDDIIATNQPSQNYSYGPYYLHSYFIKKTSDSQKSYDSEGDVMEMINKYTYFDAKYNGDTDPMFTGYQALGLNAGGKLIYEPSFQLASVKTYSPQLEDAYSMTETFYLYDGKNVASYASSSIVDAVWSRQMRTVPFQIRTTKKAPGELEIQRSNYQTYSTWGSTQAIFVNKTAEQVEDGGINWTSGIYDLNTYPYTALETRIIHSRNEFAQVTLEEDAKELLTKYDFNNIGLVKEVTIGEGESYPLTTIYTYNEHNQVESATDPNGILIEYDYDAFLRLESTIRNGQKLQEITYSHYNYGDLENDPFELRANSNYVTTSNYLTESISWEEKSFVDPLGRSIAKMQDNIVLEDIIYDIFDRPIISIKPHTGGAPTINGDLPDIDNAEFYYESAPRNTVLSSSKYTLDALSDNAIRLNYSIVSKNELLTELDQTGNPHGPTYIPGGSFWRVVTMDEDEKIIIEFTNVFGQKIATIAVDGNAYSENYSPEETGTLIKYNSHGNVMKVSNPEAQESNYFYNYLGLMFKQTTPDAGTVELGFNQIGAVIVKKDGEGVHYAMNYDKFGRTTSQARINDGTSWLADEGLAWVATGSSFADIQNDITSLINSTGVKEKEWYYNSSAPNASSLLVTNILDDVQSLAMIRGKVAQVNNYDLEGNLIELHFFSYNQNGFLASEISQFFDGGITPASKGKVFILYYSQYNRQGSYQKISVNLNANQTTDFIYEYGYDSWNRITEVKVTYKGTAIDDQIIAQYFYDNVMGTVDEKYLYDSGCSGPIDKVYYAYDDRFRLTAIRSDLLSMQLLYDEAGNGSKNYNGNINEIYANYKFALSGEVLAQPDNFQYPTFYSYWYDNLNRLTYANATLNLLDLPNAINYEEFGDVTYTYDKIGNFQTVDRTFRHNDGGGQVPPYFEKSEFTYTYLPGTNRLQNYNSNFGEGSVFIYNGNGSMITHSSNAVVNVSHARGNYPYLVYLPPGPISYLYDANDARIFKDKGVKELYIRGADGRELAVYDYAQEQMVWYVYGNKRVAKIELTECQDLRGCIPEPPACDEGMTFAQMIALQSLVYITDINTLNYPTKMFRIMTCNGDEYYFLQDEMHYLIGNYRITQQIDVIVADQSFRVEDTNGISFLSLTALLNYRLNNLGGHYKINNYNACGSIGCVSETYTCTEEVVNLQYNSIATLIDNWDITAFSNVILPTSLLRIRLCDLTEMYILLDMLPYLAGNFTVLQQIEVASSNQSFQVVMDGAAPLIVPFDSLHSYLLVLDSDVNIDGYEDCIEPCNTDIPQCSEEDFEVQEDLVQIFESLFYQTAENAQYILLPTKMYKLRLCSGLEVYILEEELHVIAGKFLLLGEIDIINYDQDFLVFTFYGWDLFPDLGSFLDYRARNRNFDVIGFYCDENGDIICPEEDIVLQDSSVTLLKQAMQGMVSEQVSLPTSFNEIKLCDETYIYLLNQEIGQLIGNYSIEQSFYIVTDTQQFTIGVNGGQPQLVGLNGLLEARTEAVMMWITDEPEDNFLEFPDGDFPEDPEISYYIEDYLGNTRVLYFVDGDCGRSKLEYVADFFPYGKILREYVCDDKERFISTEHERDQETRFDYRGARYFDSEVGRFLSVDPLVENYPSWSAYHYVADNPITFIDPSGMAWSEANRDLADRFGVFGNGEGNDTELIPDDCCPGVGIGVWLALFKPRWQGMVNRGSVNLLEGVTKSSHFAQFPPFVPHIDGEIFSSLQTYAGLGEMIMPTLEAIDYASYVLAMGAVSAGGVTLGFSSYGTRSALGMRVTYGYVGTHPATGNVKYVGISMNPRSRFAVHRGAIGTGKEILNYRVVPRAVFNVRLGARIWEQNTIRYYKLPNLLNQRNEIAEKYWMKYNIK